MRVHLEAARERRVRRLVAGAASIRRQPSASTISGARQVAAVGVDDVAGAPVHLGGLEVGVVLVVEQLAQLAVVEGREGPRQRGSARVACGVWMTSSGKVWRIDVLEAQSLEPVGGRRAGGGLPLADLVAVEHQCTRARTRKLARDRQTCEASAADRGRRSRRTRVCAPRPASCVASASRLRLQAAARGRRCKGVPANLPAYVSDTQDSNASHSQSRGQTGCSSRSTAR